MYIHIYQHIQLYCIHYTVHTYTYTHILHMHTVHTYTHIHTTYALISYIIPIQIVTQQIVHPCICTCLYSPYSICYHLICSVPYIARTYIYTLVIYPCLYIPLLYSALYYIGLLHTQLLYMPTFYICPCYCTPLYNHTSYMAHTRRI